MKEEKEGKSVGGKVTFYMTPPPRNLGLLVQHVEPRAKKKNPKGKKKKEKNF
jgi:hypothetical protein